MQHTLASAALNVVHVDDAEQSVLKSHHIVLKHFCYPCTTQDFFACTSGDGKVWPLVFCYCKDLLLERAIGVIYRPDTERCVGQQTSSLSCSTAAWWMYFNQLGLKQKSLKQNPAERKLCGPCSLPLPPSHSIPSQVVPLL